jgi:hypothetical protein
MGVVRRFTVAGLDEAARRVGRRRGLAVGAIDETGQVKAGTRTAGVKRQYLGLRGQGGQRSGRLGRGTIDSEHVVTLRLPQLTGGEPLCKRVTVPRS